MTIYKNFDVMDVSHRPSIKRSDFLRLNCAPVSCSYWYRVFWSLVLSFGDVTGNNRRKPAHPNLLLKRPANNRVYHGTARETKINLNFFLKIQHLHRSAHTESLFSRIKHLNLHKEIAAFWFDKYTKTLIPAESGNVKFLVLNLAVHKVNNELNKSNGTRQFEVL